MTGCLIPASVVMIGTAYGFGGESFAALSGSICARNMAAVRCILSCSAMSLNWLMDAFELEVLMLGETGGSCRNGCCCCSGRNGSASTLNPWITCCTCTVPSGVRMLPMISASACS